MLRAGLDPLYGPVKMKACGYPILKVMDAAVKVCVSCLT